MRADVDATQYRVVDYDSRDGIRARQEAISERLDELTGQERRAEHQILRKYLHARVHIEMCQHCQDRLALYEQAHGG